LLEGLVVEGEVEVGGECLGGDDGAVENVVVEVVRLHGDVDDVEEDGVEHLHETRVDGVDAAEVQWEGEQKAEGVLIAVWGLL
jgi:hypothetical protein